MSDRSARIMPALYGLRLLYRSSKGLPCATQPHHDTTQIYRAARCLYAIQSILGHPGGSPAELRFAGDRLRVRQQEIAASAGKELASQPSNQQPPRHEPKFPTGSDSRTVLEDQEQPINCPADPGGLPLENTWLFHDVAVPLIDSWSNSGETVDWSAAAGSKGRLPLNHEDWATALPDELMLDNFARYSSDIMTELSQGYTT